MSATREQILERLIVEIGADATSLVDALTDVQRETEKTTKKQEDLWDRARAKANMFARDLGGFVMAQIVSVTGVMAQQVRQSVKNAEAFDKMAKRTGVAAENLSTLAFAAEMNGANAEIMEGAFKDMANRLNQTGAAAEQTNAFLGAVGLSLEGLKGKSPDQVLLDLADAFSKVEDGAAKSRVAGQIMGEEYGRRMIPLLNEGRAGIEALQQEARDLGIEVSANFARDAAVFEDQMRRLDAQSMGFAQSLARAVVPGLNEVLAAFLEASKSGGFLAGLMAADQKVKDKFQKLYDGAFRAVELAAINASARIIQGLGLERLFSGSLVAMKRRVAEIAQEQRAITAAQVKAEEDAAKQAAERRKAIAKRTAIELSKIEDVTKQKIRLEQEQKALEALEARVQGTKDLTQVEALRQSIKSGAFKNFSEQTKTKLLALAEELDLNEKITKANEQRRDEERSIQSLRNQLELLRAVTAEERTRIEIAQASVEILDPIRRAEFERLSLEIAQIKQRAEAEKAATESAKRKAEEQLRAEEQQARLVDQVLDRIETVAEKRDAEIQQIRDLAMVNEEVRAREAELIAEVESRYSDLEKKGTETTKKLASEGETAAKSLQENFASFLFDPVNQGFDEMAANFIATMRKMLSNQIAQRLLGGLLGGGGASPVPSFHSGGYTGSGSGEFDAKLLPGEFVLRPQAVSAIGTKLLDQLNSIGSPSNWRNTISVSAPPALRYHDGGLVTDPGPVAGGDTSLDLTIANVSSEDQLSKFLASRKGRNIIFNHIGADGGHQVSKIIGKG